MVSGRTFRFMELFEINFIVVITLRRIGLAYIGHEAAKG